MKREYYRYAELAALLGGDQEDVRQFLLVEKVGAFVELRNQLGWADGSDGEPPADGKIGLASWRSQDKPPILEETMEAFPFVLNGWFYIAVFATRDALRSGGSRLRQVTLWPSPESMPWETFAAIGLVLSENDLWFSAGDVEHMKSLIRQIKTGGQRTPADASIADQTEALKAKERNNLLRVIVALAKEAKIDIAPGGGGASVIDLAVVKAGFTGPKERAIRDILTQAREVLEG